MNENLQIELLKRFAQKQLEEVIIPFWVENMIDDRNGGFVGEIDMDHRKNYDADKGIILNARILWTFSALYRKYKKTDHLSIADRARNYISQYFLDSEYGGYFWTLNAEGSPVNTKKQVYAQAFVMYALAEYYAATSDETAEKEAFYIFQLIEEKAFDNQKNGYLEAFSREWGELEDLRLSHLDMNEKKTMNTHLHIIEAYSRLYRLNQDPSLKERINNLLDIFYKFILNKEKNHLNLFFDEDWTPKSSAISYGHDIESAWLLLESANSIKNPNQVDRFTKLCVNLAESSLAAISPKGGLIHERDLRKPLEEQFEWWAQAEAMVGYIEAWKISQNDKYLETAVRITEFIEKYFVDRKYGEWYYRVDKNGNPLRGYEKAGFWKCPYHGVRMCLEILTNR